MKKISKSNLEESSIMTKKELKNIMGGSGNCCYEDVDGIDRWCHPADCEFLANGRWFCCNGESCPSGSCW